MGGLGVRLRALVALSSMTVSMLVVVAEPAVALSGDEASFVRWANRERAARGIRSLTVKSDLVSVARRHAARMASRRRLYHNGSLGSQVSGWRAIGENVGYDRSASAVQRRFMASSTHRATILNRAFNEIGVGVSYAHGSVWVDEVFVQRGSTARTSTRTSTTVKRRASRSVARSYAPPPRPRVLDPPPRARARRPARRPPEPQTAEMVARLHRLVAPEFTATLPDIRPAVRR